jgi:flagellar motor switch protein FliN/FliY
MRNADAAMNEAPENTETTDLEKQVVAATESVRVQAAELGELDAQPGAGDPMSLGNLMDVPVRVTVQVGRTSVALSELMRLGPGSLIELDREAHEPADVLVNGHIVARGEVVTIGDRYGVRITSVQKND